MKQRIHYLFFVCLTLSMIACTSTPPMSLHWEMGKNDVTPGVCELYYTITNLSDEPITNEGWTLYFNYMSLHPIYTEGDQLLQTELQASYHTTFQGQCYPSDIASRGILLGEDPLYPPSRGKKREAD